MSLGPTVNKNGGVGSWVRVNGQIGRIKAMRDPLEVETIRAVRNKKGNVQSVRTNIIQVSIGNEVEFLPNNAPVVLEARMLLGKLEG